MTFDKAPQKRKSKLIDAKTFDDLEMLNFLLFIQAVDIHRSKCGKSNKMNIMVESCTHELYI